jgi:hypothetical protein
MAELLLPKQLTRVRFPSPAPKSYLNQQVSYESNLYPTINPTTVSQMSNKQYTVHGDLTSDKSSENYPVKTLCEDCVANYDVITEEGESSEACEDCDNEA